jgi:hypothetical protein
MESHFREDSGPRDKDRILLKKGLGVQKQQWFPMQRKLRAQGLSFCLPTSFYPHEAFLSSHG